MKMNHAEFIHDQLTKLAPAGVDELSRDPESGSDRTWFRVRMPDMRDLLKSWKSKNGVTLTFDDWWQTVDDLYHGDSLDERIFAGLLIAAFPKFRQEVSFEQLDLWLGQLEGWKEVDNTCQSGYSADDLRVDWEAWERFLRRLCKDKNINKRRASLVLLVKPLRSDGDERFLELALHQIESLKRETNKLITKAVSWVLRAASIHHANTIRQYLQSHRESLPAIAVRETEKKLLTGKK